MAIPRNWPWSQADESHAHALLCCDPWSPGPGIQASGLSVRYTASLILLWQPAFRIAPAARPDLETAAACSQRAPAAAGSRPAECEADSRGAACCLSAALAGSWLGRADSVA